MNPALSIIKKEFINFAHSGGATFFLYALISAVWGMALLGGADAVYFREFLAVIIVGSFTNTVFISERLTGALEVLITSGFSRRAVLFGKMGYIIIMSILTFAACMIFSAIASVSLLLYLDAHLEFAALFESYNLPLYVAVAFMNVAASAYFSVRLATPRFLHFINIFITGIVLALFEVFALPISPAFGFFAAGIFFTILADKQFGGERTSRPVNL